MGAVWLFVVPGVIAVSVPRFGMVEQPGPFDQHAPRRCAVARIPSSDRRGCRCAGGGMWRRGVALRGAAGRPGVRGSGAGGRLRWGQASISTMAGQLGMVES
jgi:hypothetical protein